MFLVAANGHVGINVANPVEALDVAGNIRLAGNVVVNGVTAIGSDVGRLGR